MSSQTNHSITNDLLMPLCKDTNIDKYVGNLTSTYANKSNEAPMVAASVVMFLLAGLFFNLNLFSRFSDVSAILNPKVRVFLSSALSLFLPVMSYLFSEAKNTGTVSSAAVSQKSDLSLRAGVILVWMLLVELLRKKVDEIHMRGYSSTIQRAGRVIWLGSLVFFNIRSAGRKAFFGILWVLCAAKVVQRIAFTEVGKRSYAYGKNARLITSYMSQRLRREQHDTRVIVEHTAVDPGGDDLLKRSEFIVMGEEELIVEATADGYMLKEISPGGTVVTVGRIWRELNSAIDPDQRLKRLCLSFSLFKLLRRRFEHLPVTQAETQECRDLIFNGIYNKKEEMVDAVFQMMNTEVNFLSEYNHSVIPVVFASPFFFLANYFLLPIVVLGLCLLTVVLCGNGDAGYAFRKIETDNFFIQSGILRTTACLLVKAIRSPPAFFTAVDFSVTFLLFIIFFYEEIWEFIVFLLSNWFMVSLLCNYVGKPHWLSSTTFSGIVRRIRWVRSKMRQPALSFRQFSVLNTRWPLLLGMPSMLSLLLRTELVPNKAKHSIMESLVAHSLDSSPPLSNGKSVLMGQHQLLPACDSESVAEVILTWHIATSIFEEACPPNSSSEVNRRVATRLSRYCAYLVAFHPELLPDNPDKTEKVFEAMKAELKGKLTCCNYYFSRWRTRVSMIVDTDMADWKDKEVVHNGAKLGKLLQKYDSDPEGTWKLLADVWTELIIYVAPSNDEERVMGHEKVLVEGGEFITVLWALTTHTGITRPRRETDCC
ncbi:uncharacterized protein LOC133903902 [Phragmites australis]|uniref:uncharacterized protein LOC133903902 n=1 Tax=Phragmites australis TaxID=29695 RepID=UPI002D78EB56|nr:uncharacterized protein LOC133903902 [Phragmites australis]